MDSKRQLVFIHIAQLATHLLLSVKAASSGLVTSRAGRPGIELSCQRLFETFTAWGHFIRSGLLTQPTTTPGFNILCCLQYRNLKCGPHAILSPLRVMSSFKMKWNRNIPKPMDTKKEQKHPSKGMTGKHTKKKPNKKNPQKNWYTLELLTDVKKHLKEKMPSISRWWGRMCRRLSDDTERYLERDLITTERMSMESSQGICDLDRQSERIWWKSQFYSQINSKHLHLHNSKKKQI